MSRPSTRKRLQLKRETLQRLSDGDLARAAGGFLILRCTYEKSGCYGQTNETYFCYIEEGCGQEI